MKLEKISIEISEELKKEMDKIPYMNWDDIAIKAFKKKLEKLRYKQKTN